MAVIDIHAHAFPDDIAPRAIEKLTALGDWAPFGDGTIDGMLKSMDEADVDISAVCTISTKPKQIKGILKWLRKITDKHPDRLMPFASVHPEEKNPDKWFDRILDEGITAIKLHAFYQDFIVDDESMFPIYEAAASRNMLVAFHSGKDVGFMEDSRPDRVSPERVARVTDKFPNLRVLCTHMGGWHMWEDAVAQLAGRQVHVETSYTMPFIDKERFMGIVRALGTDRVCFGTDWPWQSRKDELKRLRSMELDKSDLDKICYVNASHLIEF
jgi:predicted TIM-barrel fold metal-dependent hydrolase